MPPTEPPHAIPSPDAERRREPRAPIELKVEYRRLNSFFADYTRNISKGGTFIGTAKPLPVGTDFVFRITVPSLAAPLELHGAVAWAVSPEQATAAQPEGMGIRFRYGDDAERERVHRVVEKLMVESLGEALYRKLLEESEANPAGQGAGGIRSE